MHEPDQPIESDASGCLIHLYVSPRASRTKLAGLHGGRLKLQVAAPPVDGAANTAIVAFVASTLGVGKSAVSIASGESGKRKTVRVEGVSVEEARERLELEP